MLGDTDRAAQFVLRCPTAADAQAVADPSQAEADVARLSAEVKTLGDNLARLTGAAADVLVGHLDHHGDRLAAIQRQQDARAANVARAR